MNGVYFNWDVEKFPKYDNNRNVGLIAQQIEAEFPELVTDGGDGYKTVKYSNMVGVLLQAVKELQAKVEELEKKKRINSFF